MATITFTAPDISCDHCKHAIETDLSAAGGVRDVQVAIAPKQVVIDYDERVTGPEALRAALDESGYPVAG